MQRERKGGQKRAMKAKRSRPRKAPTPAIKLAYIPGTFIKCWVIGGAGFGAAFVRAAE